MRRTIVALALVAMTGLAPLAARADDDQIASQIIQKLQVEKERGRLRGIDMQLKVENGEAWIRGRVATPEQKRLVLTTAQHAPGVVKVIDDLNVAADAAAPGGQQAETSSRRSSRRAPQNASAEPRSNAPARVAANAPRQADQQSSRRAAAPMPSQPTPAQHTPAQTAMARPSVGHTSVMAPAAPTNGPALARRSAVETPTPAKRTVSAIAQTAMNQQVQPASTPAQATEEQLQPQPMAAAPAPNPSQTAQPQTQAGQQMQVAWTPGGYPMQGYYAPYAPYAGYGQYGQQAASARSQQAASTPRAFAPARPAGGYAGPVQPVSHAHSQPAPIPSYNAGGGGVRPARYDHPHLPNYSWPSYAAHPNYGAVQYPKQYSPSAWPYIGPFYPYPQVPLGWRHVTLEWDDGWWMLDFKDRRRKFP